MHSSSLLHFLIGESTHSQLLITSLIAEMLSWTILFTAFLHKNLTFEKCVAYNVHGRSHSFGTLFTKIYSEFSEHISILGYPELSNKTHILVKNPKKISFKIYTNNSSTIFRGLIYFKTQPFSRNFLLTYFYIKNIKVK